MGLEIEEKIFKTCNIFLVVYKIERVDYKSVPIALHNELNSSSSLKNNY
jgi:hypothetical protein